MRLASLRVSLVLSFLSAFLCYELATFNQMTFPLGMSDDGSFVVGSNLSSQAVIWTSSDGPSIIGTGEFWGVSNDGRVGGSLANADGKEEAVLWENGTATFLGNIPDGNSCDAFYSSGLGISSDGSTVVGMGWQDCSVEAFYWNQVDGIVGLGQYNGNSTKAQAVSGDGSVIGGWVQSSSGTRQSCVWGSDGSSTLIGSLSPWSNAGEVTAFSSDGSRVVGFGASTGGNDTEAYLAIENPSVLGGYEFVGLGVPDNNASFNESMAFDISENGVVVGQYLNNFPNDWRASIWTEELGSMVDFHDYLESLGIDDLSGWTFLKAHCVSADGTIVAGTAQNTFGSWVTFVIDLSDELNEYTLGDANADGVVNILDVIDTINFILSGAYDEVVDMNADGSIDITDVIQIVSIVIG